jgi:hypothetical protein
MALFWPIITVAGLDNNRYQERIEGQVTAQNGTFLRWLAEFPAKRGFPIFPGCLTVSNQCCPTYSM